MSSGTENQPVRKFAMRCLVVSTVVTILTVLSSIVLVGIAIRGSSFAPFSLRVTSDVLWMLLTFVVPTLGTVALATSLLAFYKARPNFGTRKAWFVVVLFFALLTFMGSVGILLTQIGR